MLLSKHHGLGNDFLVALDERNDGALAVDGARAMQLCDRRRGIGADGLIHGAAPDQAQRANGIDVVMHLFNSDGSRAEMSGNGVRCLGQAVARARGLDAGTVEVLTDGGRRTLVVTAGDAPDEVDVSVEMGPARPGPRVPTNLEEFATTRHATVDLGNPHLVILVDDPDAVDLATEGPWLEGQFPHGVNVEYIAVDANRRDIRLRVWERGAGITEACGTGACAAAFSARSWGLVGDHASVAMPGGSAEVRVGSDDHITLIGPSVFIADVQLDPAATLASVEVP